MPRYRASQGYKNILVHRAICELVLDHPLPKGAVVHHVDGDRSNNSRGKRQEA